MIFAFALLLSFFSLIFNALLKYICCFNVYYSFLLAMIQSLVALGLPQSFLDQSKFS
jgi:hypothetical protein